MKKSKMIIDKCVLPIVDVIAIPFVIVAAVIMRCFREVERREMHMRITKKILLWIGVWPIIDHYYEPLFNMKNLRQPLSSVRYLPGIDLREKEQIAFLESFDYSDEINKIPWDNNGKDYKYFFDNESFSGGDADILYSMIRKYKPHKIIEIGSGYSTLMIIEALDANKQEAEAQGESYYCEHTCIEPYEMPWLEKTTAKILRSKVEEIDKSVFTSLQENDILFIDSSHIIRPQGDVLKEYLEILPLLQKGVLVHIHDIFTPRDYADDWLLNRVRFWNEQYLLEAFMTCNNSYEIVLAANYMKNYHFDLMKKRCPMIEKTKLEVGSFWIRRL